MRLHPRSRNLVSACFACILCCASAASAADIVVTTTSGSTGGPSCTLRDAANTDTATGGCPAGSGMDTIILMRAATYTLFEIDNDTNGSNSLPSVTSNIAMRGNGAVIRRSTTGGTPDFRILHVGATGDLALDAVTITNGRPGQPGGGIRSAGGVLTLMNSTVDGNEAADFGGGIAITGPGTVTLTNSTVSGNKVTGLSFGGGIDNAGAQITLTNSTVYGNEAEFGAGIANGTGRITLANSTVSGNTATGEGGGIAGSATLKNTIVAGNEAAAGPDCNGSLTSEGHNLIGDTGDCELQGDLTGNIIDTAPQLDPLQNNGGPTETQKLLDGSPAIDAGNPAGCTDTDGILLTDDQRGQQRPVPIDSPCDMGAYELGQPDGTPCADNRVCDSTRCVDGMCTRSVCVGDCAGNGQVTIGNLILGVNIILGFAPVSDCPALANADGVVTIATLITGVNNALSGCSFS